MTFITEKISIPICNYSYLIEPISLIKFHNLRETPMLLLHPQIVAKAPWAGREVNVDVRIANGTCNDITVTWKVDWTSEYGTFTLHCKGK